MLHFTNRTFPQYVAEGAHELIAEHLDQVVAGQIRRLMIFAPPQHGKSELASVRLPAFWLGRRSNDPVIITSYAASLAHDKSRQARDIVEGPEYQALFPGVGTNQASRAVHHWKLVFPHRGEVIAAGVGGPITGHGALLGIIDDPFENWEQAQSETIRNKVWDWYRRTFRTRVREGGAVVLIMTRWHEDDLAGRLLKAQGGKWVVLRLPALAETQEERDDNDRYLGLPVGQVDPLGRRPGGPLCPRRFSRPALLDIREDVGSIGWAAEYQGVPRTPEGNRFKRHWFPIVGAAPAVARRVRYWDKAATEGGGARTAGVRMSEANGVYFIEHVVKGHWSSFQRREVMMQTAQLDADEREGEVCIYVEQEPGSSGKDSVLDEIRMLAGFAVFADRPTGDKDVRLEPFAAQAEAGNVRLVRGAWNQAYIDEMCTLPNSQYRDQADATAGAFNMLVRRRKRKATSRQG